MKKSHFDNVKMKKSHFDFSDTCKNFKIFLRRGRIKMKKSHFDNVKMKKSHFDFLRRGRIVGPLRPLRRGRNSKKIFSPETS